MSVKLPPANQAQTQQQQAQSQAVDSSKNNASAEAPQLSELKTGEYMVHVFVIETRALKSAKADDATLDPLLKVRAFEQTKYSKPKEKVGSGATYWGEHYFFTRAFETTYEVESQKIEIHVCDHTSIGKDALIGSVELNLAQIYACDKHAMQYKWAALSNYSQKYEEALGFLKFSVAVTATGDSQIPLEDEKIVDKASGFSKKDILFPPQIQAIPYEFKIRLYKGESLHKFDRFVGSGCDPFIAVQYGDFIVKTNVVQKNQNPIWNEEISIPICLPTVNEIISLKLYDYEDLGKDDIMGSMTFHINDIKDGKFKKPFWVNVYGAQTNSDTKFAKLMNEVPALGTDWRGRVFLSMSAEKTETGKQPNLGKQNIEAKLIPQPPNPILYELRCEFLYAMNLPEEKGEYCLKVKWGHSELATKKKKAENRLIEFYETKAFADKFYHTNCDNEDCPDVFIYLSDGDHNISYIRLKASKLTDPFAKPNTKMLIVDRSYSKVRDDLAGIIKFRVYLFDSSKKNQSDLTKGGWDRQVVKKPSTKNWIVMVNCFQARELIAADSTGTSDPSVSAYFYGASKSTQTIQKTLSPVWNQKLDFTAAFDDPDDCPPIVVTIWDANEYTASVFLGSCILYLEKKDLDLKSNSKPEWIPIKYGGNNIPSGKLLISLNAFSTPNRLTKQIYIDQEPRLYHINLKILGVRDLQSLGLIPVKRPFIKFDMDSIRSTNEKSAVAERRYVQTEPMEKGPNANIMTVINLKVNLPFERRYCPQFSGVVYDYIFKGLSQPRLGYFTIDLEKQIEVSEKIMEEKMEILNNRVLAITEAKDREEQRKKELEEQQKQQAAAGGATSDKPQQPLEIKVDKNIEEEKKHDETNECTCDINLDQQLESAHESDKRTSFIDKITPDKFIIEPKYDTSDPEGPVEIEIPDENFYLPLGYDTKEKKNKHYRHYIQRELENTDYIDKSPFLEIPIHRGSRQTDDSFLHHIFQAGEAYKVVGYFKAMVDIYCDEKLQIFKSKMAALDKAEGFTHHEVKDQDFLKQVECLARLYIVDAYDIPAKNQHSQANPYLKIQLGNHVLDESKEYQKNTQHPTFYKCYEQYLKQTKPYIVLFRLGCFLPGASLLKIQMWDHEKFLHDDFIGETIIDLEDRYFCKKWRALSEYPIETRSLYHPSSSLPQGALRMWLEILPKNRPAFNKPKRIISPKPPSEFELRFIVWECKDIPRVDTITDTVDIYISAKVNDDHEHELKTDTHFSSTNGKGSFNWRMVWPVTLPMDRLRMTLQVWDKDILSPDDYISEATIDFSKHAKKAFDSDKPVKVHSDEKLPNGKKDPKFWIACEKSKGTKLEQCGEILCSFELLPKNQAKLVPVGQGRTDPNLHPYLPPPVGRIHWSWNPITMIEQFVGPVARKKCLLICCGVCTIILLVFMAPMIISTKISMDI